MLRRLLKSDWLVVNTLIWGYNVCSYAHLFFVHGVAGTPPWAAVVSALLGTVSLAMTVACVGAWWDRWHSR